MPVIPLMEIAVKKCKQCSDIYLITNNLISSDKKHIIPCTHNRFGARSFGIISICVWNDFPSSFVESILFYLLFSRQTWVSRFPLPPCSGENNL